MEEELFEKEKYLCSISINGVLYLLKKNEYTTDTLVGLMNSCFENETCFLLLYGINGKSYIININNIECMELIEDEV